jgi:excinuclease ABC subunit A
MPWEVNGRKWHTGDGLAHNGKSRRWKGEILAQIVDELEATEQFAPTNWNDRSTVEITAKAKGIAWFLHALTGDEWLLTLKFRVPKKTFDEAVLADELALKDVNDLDHIPVYNRQPRVRIRPSANGPFEDVTISIIEPEEIQTPEFRNFLKTAVKVFVERANPKALKLEDLTPWKKLGRKWHLMRKGFLQGTIEWPASVLEDLIGLLDELLPSASVDWTQKVLVNYSVEKTVVATVVTKRPAGIDLAVIVPSGTVQLGEVATFGIDPEVASHKPGQDVIRLRFTQSTHVKSPELRMFLAARWKK